MKKFYFTRKNLIEIAIVFLFAVLYVFVFASVDANHTILAQGNPIEELYLGMGLPPIGSGTTGYVTAILVAAFMTLGDVGVISMRRLAKFKEERFFSFKWLIFSFLIIVLCLALSVGVGVLYISIAGGKVLVLLTILGSTLLVTLLLALVIGGLLLAGVGIYVNFKNINKPYRFFNVAELEEVESDIDDAENTSQKIQGDLAAQFGEVSVEGSGSGSGAGGVGGGGGVVSEVMAARKLDDREKVFPSLSRVDREYGGYEAPVRDVTNITLEQLAKEFRLYLAAHEGLYFEISAIRAFISSFGASRMVILEGLSGTGKSSLPRYFAKFISSNANFIPVQTTWRDKSSLVGYFNDFTQTFNETEFLKSLYRATYEKDTLNLMVLDEFNIARVEYYFADFLSILEYPEEEQIINVMQLPFDFIPPTHLYDGDLKIAPNTFFVCTANKDDSTYSISDKVYDRAIILDFDDLNEPFVATAKYENMPIGFGELHNLYEQAKANTAYRLSDEDLAKFRILTNFAYEEFDVAFGNRIFHQINEFVPVYVATGGTLEEGLDLLFATKILRKVEGRFEDYIKNGLLNLEKLITKEYGKSAFKESRHLINVMVKRL